MGSVNQCNPSYISVVWPKAADAPTRYDKAMGSDLLLHRLEKAGVSPCQQI